MQITTDSTIPNPATAAAPPVCGLGQVLADALVAAFFIPNREIAEIDELLPQLDAEFGRVPRTGFKSIQVLIDSINTFR